MHWGDWEMPGQGKRPLTEAQKAALAKGQAARKRNIATRRASRARQTASSQVASLPGLARDALQTPGQPASPAATSRDASSTASSTSSSPNKLSQAEQDKLLFDFAMGDDEEPAAAAAEPGKKTTVGDKLAGLLLNDSPREKTGNQQEDDAAQAAAQWQDLGAIAFIFVCGQVFGADLAPSEKQAQAMAAPLCRVLMRHVAPLRQASADAYDIAAFAGACLIYYQSISPELARRRAERKVLSASPKAPEQGASASRQPGGGSDSAQRGNVRILHPEDTPGRGRYPEQPAQAGRVDVRQDEQQPDRRDAGAALVSETLGIEL